MNLKDWFKKKKPDKDETTPETVKRYRYRVTVFFKSGKTFAVEIHNVLPEYWQETINLMKWFQNPNPGEHTFRMDWNGGMRRIKHSEIESIEVSDLKEVNRIFKKDKEDQ